MTRRVRIVLLRFLTLAALLLVWEALTGGLGLGWKVFETSILARPSLIAADFLAYGRSGLLLRDVQATLTAAFLGLFLGAIGGIAVGLLFG